MSEFYFYIKGCVLRFDFRKRLKVDLEMVYFFLKKEKYIFNVIVVLFICYFDVVIK